MTDVRIRQAGPADLPVLRRLYRRSSLSNAGDVAALCAHPGALFLTDEGVNQGRTRVATLTSDQIVGFATTLQVGRIFELEDIFVDPDWMRVGIGRLLLRDAVALAGRQGVRRVEVTANLHALTFYESAGFVPDDEVTTRFGIARRMHLDIAATQAAD